MDTIRIDKGSTQMIAHRGLSGLEMENTVPAFIAAGNRSYYGVETDLRRTGDGRFIIAHDRSTGRVAEKDMEVESSPYELIRSLKVKDLTPSAEPDMKQPAEAAGTKTVEQGIEAAGAKAAEQGTEPDGGRELFFPSLKEYVRVCRKYEKVCILELVSQFTSRETEQIAEEIKELDYLSHVTFISFFLQNLVQLRELLPEQELYYLTFEFNEEILAHLKRYRLNLDIEYSALTREIVEQLHREGIKVNCWTCDDREEAQRMASWGVDYITSNILE